MAGENGGHILLLVVACFSVQILSMSIIKPEESPRPLLGTQEKICTWGPSYWCTNITTAKNCNAVRHCIQTVWEHQTLPEDNDDICKLCKDMVKQARDQLESNETQEELKEVFEGSCNLIPLKPVAKGCDKLVDEFIPELVETLSSQMNPQMVCAVAGLCNNAEIDRMLAAQGKLVRVHLTRQDSSVSLLHPKVEKKSCDGCNQVMDKLRKKFKSTSRDDMLNNMVEVCGKLGSLSDGCSAVVISYFSDIYDLMGKTLAPEDTCQLLEMCSEDFKKSLVNVEIVNESSVGVVPVGDNMTCEFCEHMIQHLRDILVANTTEDEFELVLRGLCKQTGKFKDQCLSIVTEYYGMIYNFLVNYMDGKEICSLAGMCPQPGGPRPQAVMGPRPLLPVDIVVDEKLVGRDEDESLRHPVVHIKTSTDAMKVHVISDPASMQLPIERMNFFLINIGSHKEACAFCEYFLHYVQTQLTDVRTEEKVKHVVEKACDRLPKTINSQCKDFVEQFGEAFIAILVQEIDPSLVCPGMGFCPTKNQSQIVVVGNDQKLKDKPSCGLCLLAVTQLDEMVKNNKSEESIKEALLSICNDLPKHLKDDCSSFVNKYSDQIINSLIADLTPQEICVYIKLCDPKQSIASSVSGGDILTNEVPQYENTKLVKKGNKDTCVLCEFVMTRLEEMLKQNATEEEIKAAVHRICNHMPKSINPQCNKFVDQYSDLIIQLLTNSVDPKSLCTEIDLCDPDRVQPDRIALNVMQEEVKKSVEECALCEGVIQALDVYLEDPNVEHEIDDVLMNICDYMQLHENRLMKCRRFIYEYGSRIQQIIAQIPASRLICSKMGVCGRGSGAVELLGGHKCTWGPSYWCQSEEHASVCGQGSLQHCRERVWSGDRPAVIVN